MKPVKLDLLTSSQCVHCEAFRTFWKSEASHWPNVTFTEVSALTPEGQSLVTTHMIFATPGIFLNDELFSSGGFEKEGFLAKLKSIS